MLQKPLKPAKRFARFSAPVLARAVARFNLVAKARLDYALMVHDTPNLLAIPTRDVLRVRYHRARIAAAECELYYWLHTNNRPSLLA